MRFISLRLLVGDDVSLGGYCVPSSSFGNCVGSVKQMSDRSGFDFYTGQKFGFIRRARQLMSFCNTIR